MLELLSSQEMAEADALTIAGGISGLVLMEAAGLAVADVAARSARFGETILVVAGPGNNGGDGFVAARVLAERGWAVRLMLVGDSAKLKGDAAAVAQRWTGPVERPEPGAVAQAGLVIDALFGAGLDRAVTGMPATMIEAMSQSGRPVVAVDLPSGINGTTGRVMGVAVKARKTVTFFRRKPGHLLLPGRDHCGEVIRAQIGIPDRVLDRIRPKTFVNAVPLWGPAFPVPNARSHEYTRGHAVVVGGGMPRTGASRLAARAALRAGAGLVTIATPGDALSVQAAANDAVMVTAVDGGDALNALLEDRRFNAVLLGPGGGVGPAMREKVLAALSGDRSVVLDADALTSFAENPGELFAALARRPGASVLTPHEGEFGRLFGNAAMADESKLERARSAARLTQVVILLKGSDTVVAAPDGRAAIAENAPPWLATAGSGDVLAGLVTGLLAQGMPPFEAAAGAVWLHGAAGAASGPGLIAEDISEAIPGVYSRIFALFQKQ